MSVKIDPLLCNGCQGQDEANCVKLCPGDLLTIDQKTGKPYIRNEADCWDCMVCVKGCPLEAIETVLPYQLASYKATLKPRVLDGKIIWHLRDARGNEETYELKTSS